MQTTQSVHPHRLRNLQENWWKKQERRACSVFNREGLFDMKQARPVTAPIYSDITAVSDQLFKCELPRTDKAIVIDNNGRILE